MDKHARISGVRFTAWNRHVKTPPLTRHGDQLPKYTEQ